MTIEKASKILAKCEADLRALVSSAADQGDYDAVLRITSWAKQLSSMALAPAAAAATPKQTSAPRTKQPPIPSTYPRFVRRGEQLVKFGWSKREKTEYEHKAPRQAVLALAQSAARAGKDGRIFQINALQPLTLADGNEVPDYQVYLVIAWWRSAGLVDQHGRQGYSIPNAAQLSQAAESAWNRLPEE